jgi:hypothetical protein
LFFFFFLFVFVVLVLVLIVIIPIVVIAIMMISVFTAAAAAAVLAAAAAPGWDAEPGVRGNCNVAIWSPGARLGGPKLSLPCSRYTACSRVREHHTFREHL